MTNSEKPQQPLSKPTQSAPKQKPAARSKPKRPRSEQDAQGLKISSASQSLISVFILAIGLAAVAAVGYLAYSRFNSSPAPNPGTQTIQAGADASTTQQEQIAEQPSDTTAPNAANLVKATSGQFVGNWVARSGSQTVYVTLNADKSFEIVAFVDRSGFERRYSKGTYNYEEEEGVLTLRAGYDPLPEIQGVRMKTLTRRSYGVIPLIDKKSGGLLWVSQNRGENASRTHPIFGLLGRNGSYIVWSKGS